MFELINGGKGKIPLFARGGYRSLLEKRKIRRLQLLKPIQ